jgi:hypothetical protein
LAIPAGRCEPELLAAEPEPVVAPPVPAPELPAPELVTPDPEPDVAPPLPVEPGLEEPVDPDPVTELLLPPAMLEEPD